MYNKIIHYHPIIVALIECFQFYLLSVASIGSAAKKVFENIRSGVGLASFWIMLNGGESFVPYNLIKQR